MGTQPYKGGTKNKPIKNNLLINYNFGNINNYIDYIGMFL